MKVSFTGGVQQAWLDCSDGADGRTDGPDPRTASRTAESVVGIARS